jgi:hypothetical protein
VEMTLKHEGIVFPIEPELPFVNSRKKQVGSKGDLRVFHVNSTVNLKQSFSGICAFLL